ncbi:type I restriction-modification system subunit M [Marinomonas transparens]|uniref:site-specific DNA-methyltransferase (adenine-specific) n=1 Tax=Marinomonas transparens TaxID=2795388 RepID=A0A934JRQ1_9GAMM|nr:type I restriction-modification system subunit M [Marinomonas transparens]MBJ7538623.1 type I restriction-modification system subunit M [Marinomonas transparens]
MAIKKTELYSSLWASCDELRGGMDASQYKDYVLTMLFMKYVSDKYKGDPYGMITIPTGASFDDMVALKNHKAIGDEINKIIAALAEENKLKGVIDVADFNDEDKLGKDKEKVDRLTKLVGIFQGLDLSDNRAEGDDLLGDAYEYLMRHFATESGKSKGQFYTPSEVSQILAKVVGIEHDTPQDATVYDPTCGSGSLLLKASNEAPRGLSIYGQEMDNATSALGRMNMILHNNITAKIVQGNTLSSPEWKDAPNKLKTFDFAVANPPFSNKNWTSGLDPKSDLYKRFAWGVPPEKNGDYTFLLHIITSLKSTGKGAVILPHGVLFRGNAEANIRQNLIQQGYIKGIIGLPANLFYGTGIPACIIVIDKEHAQKSALSDDGKMKGRSIFMIDASKGFIKDGNKNRLRSQDIHKVVDVFNKGLEVERFSRLISIEEIAKNDYNLNIPRYIDSSEPEDLHDLSAHLQGGIPNRDIDALENFWQVFPNIRATLFTENKGQAAREGYSHALIEASKVKNTILAHPEFKDFASRSLLPFKAWVHDAALSDIALGDKPKELIQRISEQLLSRYTHSELLSKYDIYQILMDYWADTLQDDVYVLTQDGWQAGNTVRELVVAKGEKLKETPDFTINKQKYKAELIPPNLIIARYFASEQAAINQLQAQQDAATQALDNYLEEHTSSGSGSTEEGLLADALNDKDKITKASVAARLKLTTNADEITALKQVTKLFNADAACKKAVKGATEKLDLKVLNHYPTLSLDDVKSLIVQDKWLATLQANIIAEIERVTQQMANRVKELEERYSAPLPTLTQSVDDLSGKVADHLKAMGLEWTV